MMDAMNLTEKGLVQDAGRLIPALLPPGWQAESIGAKLRITSREGRTGELAVKPLVKPEPRAVASSIFAPHTLITAKYLSPAVRALLGEASVSYLDQTGHARLVLEEPGLFILTQGAQTNPWPEPHSTTMRGTKAGEVICALVCAPLPIGVRALAAAASADPGYVSRLLELLDREALVERDRRGRVVKLRWRKLLAAWAEEAPLERRTAMSTWIDPRGLKHLWEQLRATNLLYAITGSAAAAPLAPIAPTRLATLYVEHPEEAAASLGLTATTAGANILLLQPQAPSLFSQIQTRDGLRFAPLPVAVADLLTGPGRAPAEAQALMDWMDTHEEVWRG
jgi:hypothetical protein